MRMIMGTNKQRPSQRGVTLIEMLVVIGIFGVVASVLFFNGAAFDNNISVRNLSQDIGLAIRKAQVYATSVRNSDLSTTGVKMYGISFSFLPPTFQGQGVDVTSPLAVNNKQFVIFADMSDKKDNPAYVFDGSAATCGQPTAQNECLELFKITTGDYISAICFAPQGTVDPICVGSDMASAGGQLISRVNIVFRRPSPNANFYVTDTEGNCMVGDAAFLPDHPCNINSSFLMLKIKSASGSAEKSITVWNNGQIEVL